jgi:hypothetical protein
MRRRAFGDSEVGVFEVKGGMGFFLQTWLAPDRIAAA